MVLALYDIAQKRGQKIMVKNGKKQNSKNKNPYIVFVNVERAKLVMYVGGLKRPPHNITLLTFKNFWRGENSFCRKELRKCCQVDILDTGG